MPLDIRDYDYYFKSYRAESDTVREQLSIPYCYLANLCPETPISIRDLFSQAEVLITAALPGEGWAMINCDFESWQFERTRPATEEDRLPA